MTLIRQSGRFAGDPKIGGVRQAPVDEDVAGLDVWRWTIPPHGCGQEREKGLGDRLPWMAPALVPRIREVEAIDELADQVGRALEAVSGEDPRRDRGCDSNMMHLTHSKRIEKVSSAMMSSRRMLIATRRASRLSRPRPDGGHAAAAKPSLERVLTACQLRILA